MDYCTTITRESHALPGAHFTFRRMSFGRRLELARQLQETLRRMDAALAAAPGERRDAEVATLAAEADAGYLRWGLIEVEGLEIDGRPATTESLLASGPEALVLEIIEAIKAEAGLSEEERKNSGSPSTSSAVGRQDRASDGSATPAGDSDFTNSATAAGTSPSCSAPIPRVLCGSGAAKTELTQSC